MATTDFELSGSYKRTTPGPDLYWYSWADGTPYADKDEAIGRIPQDIRKNRTVLLVDGEYWWPTNDLSDTGLIKKGGTGGGPVTAYDYDGAPKVFATMDEAAAANTGLDLSSITLNHYYGELTTELKVAELLDLNRNQMDMSAGISTGTAQGDFAATIRNGILIASQVNPQVVRSAGVRLQNVILENISVQAGLPTANASYGPDGVIIEFNSCTFRGNPADRIYVTRRWAGETYPITVRLSGTTRLPSNLSVEAGIEVENVSDYFQAEEIGDGSPEATTKEILQILWAERGSAGQVAPAAPTNITVDPATHNAGFDPASGKTYSDYEYKVRPGVYADVPALPFFVGYAAGTMDVRLKADGATPPGLPAAKTYAAALVAVPVFGNSLQTIFNDPDTSGLSVPQLLDASLSSDARVSNVISFAVAGATLVNTGNNIKPVSEQIADYLAGNPLNIANAVHIVEGGINDTVTPPIPTAQQIYDRQQANIATLYAAGARRILVDGLTSATGSYGTISDTDLLALKAAVNQLYRDHILDEPGVVGFLDSGSFPEIGADDAGDNMTYFLPDNIHYTATGRAFKNTNVYKPGVQKALNGETGFVISGQPGGTVTPNAPTGATTNDVAKTFDWTNTPGYTVYEYTLNAGSTYATATAKPQPVGNFTYAPGQVGVRVKAGSGNTASATLYNTAGFTQSSSGSVFAREQMIYELGVTTYAELPSSQKATINGVDFVGFLNSCAPPLGNYSCNRLRFKYFVESTNAKDGDLWLDGVKLTGSDFSFRSGTGEIIFSFPLGIYHNIEIRTQGAGNFGYGVSMEPYTE